LRPQREVKRLEPRTEHYVSGRYFTIRVADPGAVTCTARPVTSSYLSVIVVTETERLAVVHDEADPFTDGPSHDFHDGVSTRNADVH
jgi:hypothetical protein